jgi:hypothetical protein
MELLYQKDKRTTSYVYQKDLIGGKVHCLHGVGALARPQGGKKARECGHGVY